MVTSSEDRGLLSLLSPVSLFFATKLGSGMDQLCATPGGFVNKMGDCS